MTFVVRSVGWLKAISNLWFTNILLAYNFPTSQMKTLTFIKLKTTFQKTMPTAGRRNVLRVWQGGGSNYRSEGNKKKHASILVVAGHRKLPPLLYRLSILHVPTSMPSLDVRKQCLALTFVVTSGSWHTPGGDNIVAETIFILKESFVLQDFPPLQPTAVQRHTEIDAARHGSSGDYARSDLVGISLWLLRFPPLHAYGRTRRNM